MNILVLIVCIAIPLGVGAISGIMTRRNISTWYLTLRKPSFNPPNKLFAPVWTLLYILMGFSLYHIWESPVGNERMEALGVFVIQLVLNFAWSFLFFEYKKISWAFVEILMLWCSIVAMIFLFVQIDLTAGLLQIPYLLWVSFATALNGAIRKLN